MSLQDDDIRSLFLLILALLMHAIFYLHGYKSKYNLLSTTFLFSYIVVAIDMIREIMKRWWKQLQIIGKNEKQEFDKDFRCSRYSTVTEKYTYRWVHVGMFGFHMTS